eukprot:1086430_1
MPIVDMPIVAHQNLGSFRRNLESFRRICPTVWKPFPVGVFRFRYHLSVLCLCHVFLRWQWAFHGFGELERRIPNFAANDIALEEQNRRTEHALQALFDDRVEVAQNSNTGIIEQQPSVLSFAKVDRHVVTHALEQNHSDQLERGAHLVGVHREEMAKIDFQIQSMKHFGQQMLLHDGRPDERHCEHLRDLQTPTLHARASFRALDPIDRTRVFLVAVGLEKLVGERRFRAPGRSHGQDFHHEHAIDERLNRQRLVAPTAFGFGADSDIADFRAKAGM